MTGARLVDATFLAGLARVTGVDLNQLSQEAFGLKSWPAGETKAFAPTPQPTSTSGTALAYAQSLVSRLSTAQVERFIGKMLDGSLATWLDTETPKP